MKIELLSLHEYIEMAQENKLIIPNFQREYIWGVEEVKSLIASLFFRLQIGTFLLYRESSDYLIDERCFLPFITFQSNNIYTDPTILKEGISQSYYVIDGQQRLTSSLIVFSNYYDSAKIRIRKFKYKYYLRVCLRDNSFGVADFEFKIPQIGSSHTDYDSFKENNIVYYPKSADSTEKSKDCYLLPLEDLYVPGGGHNKVLRSHINSIAEMSLRQMLNEQEISDDRKDIEENAQAWKDEFYTYLSGLLDQGIAFIEVKDNLIEAIKTYEIINKSGKPLDDLDILAAHYSTSEDSQEGKSRLYDVIREGFLEPIPIDQIDKVDESRLFSRTIKQQQKDKTITNEEWNFTSFLVGLENKDVPKGVRDQLIKLMKFISIDKNNSGIGLYSIDSYKSDKILKMSGQEIKDSINDAIQCIKWAGMFLQIRCGLRSISDLNYYWQLFVIAALKYKIKDINDKNQRYILVWYFLSRFSGRYRTNQNENALADLNGLIEKFSSNKKYLTMNIMLDEIKFDTSIRNISTKELRKEVLTASDDIYDIYRKVENFICEFSIRDGYESRLFPKDTLVSTLLYPITGKSSLRLEIHHLFPLNQDKKLYESTSEKRSDITLAFNAPLNKAYITSVENKWIGTRTLKEYHDKLGVSYIEDASIVSKYELKEMLDHRYEVFFKKLYNEMSKILVSFDE